MGSRGGRRTSTWRAQRRDDGCVPWAVVSGETSRRARMGQQNLSRERRWRGCPVRQRRSGQFEGQRRCSARLPVGSRKELLGRIEGKFGPMQLVSTCRAGATVAGTGKPSRHRDGNAIDFMAGARKQAVVEWLIANHANGGTMTYRDMDHIHIDIGPHFLAIASGGRSGRDWSSDKMGLSAAK